MRGWTDSQGGLEEGEMSLTGREQEWLHGQDGSKLGFEDGKIFNGQSWWG